MDDSARTRRQVVVLALITALCLAGDSMLYIVLPIRWQEAGIGALWEVGLILSVNRLARLPLNPLAGWLYTKISVRCGILTATLLAVLTAAGYAAAPGLIVWIGLRVLWGLSWSLLKLGSFSAILEASRGNGKRGQLIGTYNGLYRMGSLLGMLGGGLLADNCGFTVTALLCAAVAVPAVALTLFLVPCITPRRAEKFAGSDSWAWLRAFSSPSALWVLATVFLVAFVVQGVLASTLSPLVALHVGSNLSCFGLALGCASVAGMLQALRWAWEPWLAPWFGKLSDGPRGRGALLAGGLWGLAALFALVTLPLGLPLWLGVIIGIQLVCTAITTLSDTVATDLAEQLKLDMLVLTAYVFMSDLGAALGPLAAFALSDLWGLNMVYRCAACALVLFAVRWSWHSPLFRQSQRQHV